MNTEFARLALLALTRSGHDLSSSIADGPHGELLSNNAALVVLCRLAAAKTLRPIDLLESVQMTSGGLAKLLDRLETAGLVARLDAAPSDDGRGVDVALTRNGRAALDELLVVIGPGIESLARELAALSETYHDRSGH